MSSVMQHEVEALERVTLAIEWSRGASKTTFGHECALGY
jgi:hypothetical protein